tara:strand:+ start:153 stop:350 length:198 start_codon:yes stop_codon:yes gene_type:complete
MRKTDGRVFYLEDTVPYKEGFMTVQVYESNHGKDIMDTLEVNISIPPKDGSKIRLSKHIKVKFNE